MDIIVGRYTGYCSGVKLAMLNAKRALGKGKGLYSLGEIIHNPQAVEGLKKRGMKVVDSPGQVPVKARFIVRSHGLPVETLAELKRRKAVVCDGTCTKIKRIQALVRKADRRKVPVIIIGKSSHPEVRSVASFAPGGTIVIETPGEAGRLPPMKEAEVVVQTTFNPSVFCAIVCVLVEKIKRTVVTNTLCEETILRQKEAKDLASQADVIVIVGGKHSSNTKTLYELVKDRVKAHHIDDASEILPEWFGGVRKAAVISGASTPSEEVEKTVRRIREMTKS